ncbi:MAG: hypothetical protein ABI612_02300 [Betaproteobacteria bacterium]
MSDDTDRELDALLAEIASLKLRASAVEQPPAHLDDAIRAAARRAAHVRPRLAGSLFNARWRIPLSVAAVVVVSATLTLMVAERHSPAPMAIPPVAVNQPAPAIAPEPARNSAPDESAALERKSVRREAAPPLAAESTTVAPQLRRKESEASSAGAPPSSNVAPATAAPRQTFSGPPASKTAAPQDPAPTQTFTPAPPSAADADADADAGAGADASAAASSPPSNQPTNSALAPPPSSPSATEAARASEQLREDSKSHLQADERAAGDEPIRDYGVAQLRAPAMRLSPEYERRKPSIAAGRVQPNSVAPGRALEAYAADWQATPQVWLKHIEGLQKAGLMDEARASFEGLRKRFPAFVLPEGFVVPTR